MRDERNKRFGKTLLALTLALVLLLTSVAGAVEVFAEESLKPIDFANGIVVEKPEPKAPITEDAKAEEEKANPAIENDAKEEKAELELGDEIAGDPVGAAVKAPTVNAVLYDDTTISGANLAKAKVGREIIIATVHVTLKGEDGTVKANLSVTPTSGTTWKVDLPQGKKVEEGDTVTVYQQIGEDKSPEVTKDAQPSKAATVTLTMPTGDIWIEQYVANIVNADEKAEAIDLLKKANPDVANDFKSVEFKITGIDPNKGASYIVTYTDNTTTGEIQAPGLTVKPVTETSRSPEIDSITIVDNVVKGKLPGPGPFNNIKVQLILRVGDANKGTFCDEGKCSVDKNSSTPVEVTVDGETGEFAYTLTSYDKLELDQLVGVSVKEPHKFVSCSTTTVKPVIPEKTEVKDPGKLTAKDKEAIDAAIRKAYTVDGISKLPNGTGDWKGVPAVIQFDDSGNVKIFSGNDVAGTWDPNNGYKFVPEKNEDGSYKLKDGAEPTITIPAKDLVKNIKPDAPTVALSGDKKNITITPNLEIDTDAHIITVSYKDKDNKEQKITATKADDGTWSITEGEGSVDANGVITLPKDNVKGGTDVTAKVTDKGGIAEDDTTPLTSDPGSLTIEETKADKVEALGGLDSVDMKKWVGDNLDWKEGVKAKDSASEENKGKINELLKEAKTSFADTTRNTNSEGDFTGTIKVTFDDGSSIEVKDQKLYVSNYVTSMERKDKVPKGALDVQFKLGEGVKVEDKDPNSGEVTKTTKGDKDNPVLYKEYKVKPGTDFSTYKHPTLQKTIFDLIDEKADEGYIDAVWKDSNGGENFVASDTNKVFTATATKTYNVTVVPNGGKGTEITDTKKSGEKYTLPKGDTFTPPNENQEFAGWLVGDATTTTEPGTEITINSDTVIKASWKPIMVDVSFDKGEGSGIKDKVSVAKGSEYTLPNSDGFTAPKNKEFAGWQVGKETKKPGDKITVNENTVVKALWKAKAQPGKDTDNKEERPIFFYFKPTTKPVLNLKDHSQYMIGYKDGTFRPNNKMSRQEVTVMLSRLLSERPQKGMIYSRDYKDVADDLWSVTAISYMSNLKMVKGYPDGNFRPYANITRAEFAAMVVRFENISAVGSKTFTDMQKDHWAYEVIQKAAQAGWISGYPDGSFKPDQSITRGEVVTITNRMLNRFADEEYVDHNLNKIINYTDIDKSHWAYYPVVEATNGHNYERKGNGKDETWFEVTGSTFVYDK